MRLFLAIELPDEVRQHLASVSSSLEASWARPGAERWPAVSWTKESNLHVTLTFLGEVPNERLPELQDGLATVPMPPSPLRLFAHRLRAFPSSNAARVIVARVMGHVEELTALHAAIEARCAAMGFERENRPFRPHVTLGRPRVPLRGEGAWAALEAAVEERWPGPEFEAASFSLVQSRLNPAGAVYTRLATFCGAERGVNFPHRALQTPPMTP